MLIQRTLKLYKVIHLEVLKVKKVKVLALRILPEVRSKTKVKVTIKTRNKNYLLKKEARDKFKMHCSI